MDNNTDNIFLTSEQEKIKNIDCSIKLRNKYPHLMALIYDTKYVDITWKFDEQQADPIHNTWKWHEAISELKYISDELCLLN